MEPTPKVYEAPYSADTRILMFNGSVPATIAVRDIVAYNESQTHTHVRAPLGTTQLFSARRQCGDWYAEFTAGRRIKSAVAEKQADAVRLAALAMEAA